MAKLNHSCATNGTLRARGCLLNPVRDLIETDDAVQVTLLRALDKVNDPVN